MYDIIGDIHGYAGPLKALLQKLGYAHDGVSWAHSERKVVFLGDFIDRGPDQIEVIEIAKAMVEAGQALAVMGNHELNAIGWATPAADKKGGYLRLHLDRNLSQHVEYLDQVGENSSLHQEHIEWFKTLPLFLDLDELRAVHACWDANAIDVLSPYLLADGTINPDHLAAFFDKQHAAYGAVETLLKGVETPLPAGNTFQDKDGIPRRKTRCKWWFKDAKTFQDLAFVSDDVFPQIPDVVLTDNPVPGYDDAKPVFVGHYWLSGTPQKLTDTIACLDYSIAGDLENGKVVAYRLNQDELTLNNEQFLWVGHD